MEAYERAWREKVQNGKVFGLPSNMQHDMHRLIGWSYTLGLHIDSAMVRTVGELAMPETEAENAQLVHVARIFWHEVHDHGTADFRNELVARASPIIPANARALCREAATMIHSNVAADLYPEFFLAGQGFVDKDGLVDYRELLQRTKLIQPGVFHEPKRDLLLYAHPFYRRSLSHINKLNTYFLGNFHTVSLEHPALSMRLRLDPDSIGHPASARELIELEYWRGPHFSDDISSIRSGVAEHKGDQDDRLFHGIDRTQIWWKAPESRREGDKTFHYRTLEAEELIEDTSKGISDDHYGCRYVHAEYCSEVAAITHFDGAIRAYKSEHYLARIDLSIDRAGKQTDYTKLFRFDGSLRVDTWKSLLTDFFQGNKLIPEYLGAPPKQDDNVQSENVDAEIMPNELGLAAYIALGLKQGDNTTQLWAEERVSPNGRQAGFAETGVGAVHTYLNTRFKIEGFLTGGFSDGVLNLARLNIGPAPFSSTALSDELAPLVDALQQDVDGGTVHSASIPLTWEYEFCMVTLTIAGEAQKVAAALRQLPGVIDPLQLPSAWIEKLSKLVKSLSSQVPSWGRFQDLRLGRLSVPRPDNDSIQIHGSEELFEQLGLIGASPIDEDANRNSA